MFLDVFSKEESEVRYYCRKLPKLLVSARGAIVRDIDGRRYVDFMSACGALNYGHNHPVLKRAALEYLAADGIIAGLDFHTSAKLAFVERFRAEILSPRGLNHKLQFPGPTGANSVEAAIKLARKATGRTAVVAFTNAFHGMSAGALSLTGSATARRGCEPLLNGVIRIPFEGYRGASFADLARFEAMANDPSGGVDPIAAVVVETVQGEGGLNVASAEWLRALSGMTKRLGALLVVDDIQASCGRTGTFFSFERARIDPDIVCLAKSISGLGLPMSLLLLKPEHDIWAPGEHNGTFRGNALAFVTATAAIGLWNGPELAAAQPNSEMVEHWLDDIAVEFAGALRPKGIGMMRGVEFSEPERAQAAAASAMRRGVIIECCGPRDEVLKIMPPLNIPRALLKEGLDAVGDAIREAFASARRPLPPEDTSVLRLSERYDSRFDGHDDGGDAVACSELAHSVA